MSCEVKLSSDEKNIIKTFKFNYNREILTNELPRILKFDKGTQKRQVNYIQLLEKICIYKKKEQ